MAETPVVGRLSRLACLVTLAAAACAACASRSEALLPGSESAVAAARRDLADRFGVAESQIELAAVEAVEWRDASLGCPEPGRFYAQVITPGYRIVLRAGGEQHEYHSDAGGRVVYCTKMP